MKPKRKPQRWPGRAADEYALSGYTLPAPGAPEPLSGHRSLSGLGNYVGPMGDCGCGCKGSGKCAGMGGGLRPGGGGLADAPGFGVVFSSPIYMGAAGVGVYLLYKLFKKKR